MSTFEQGFKDETEKISAKFKLRTPKPKAPKGKAKSPLTGLKTKGKALAQRFYAGK